MITREYHRPIYGVHGSDDVLALLDDKLSLCQERNKFAFVMRPVNLGWDIESFLLILNQWKREQRIQPRLQLRTDGSVLIALLIPKSAVVITA